ncbi:hypothetical protein Gferi_26165 [Geosporobacter ferrireducens]|uniref:Glycoside hydrolase n=1 Tax=Geosporobacter ferrireducens TaxID=1424294 RepID=A0A1D8GR25_9FIRM|nr:hypothetical protein Gferi_26165 [Geosporobacter ferrireducens]
MKDNEDDWYLVELSNGSTGWVYNDLIIPVEEKKDLIKKGLITGENLNVRKSPDMNAEVVKTIGKDTQVTIVDEMDGWFHIILQDDLKGWVHSDYVSTKPNYSTGRVTGSNVNLRANPSMDAKVLIKLNQDTYVAVKGFQEGWYSVIDGSDREGWIHQDFIAIVLDNSDASTPVSRSASRFAGLAKLGEYAKGFLGTPYKYGTSGPKSFDCSGFTSYIFKNFGVVLPRSSKDQATAGEKVLKKDLSLGDLVFFDTVGKIDGKITHVGMYIGDGKFIHASSGSSAKKVVISELNEGYYKDRFVTARRIFN